MNPPEVDSMLAAFRQLDQDRQDEATKKAIAQLETFFLMAKDAIISGNRMEPGSGELHINSDEDGNTISTIHSISVTVFEDTK